MKIIGWTCFCGVIAWCWYYVYILITATITNFMIHITTFPK
jgi:hypothetical protein